MAQPLTDADIDDLAAWFSSLDGLHGSPVQVPPLAASCSACHSEQAAASNPLWPRLAGQNAPYLAKQMHDLRDGRRRDAVMSPLAASLSDDDIAQLARYYADL